MKRASWRLFYFLLLTVTGCSTSNELQLSGQLYFPLRVGNYQVYQVSVDTIKQLVCGTGGDKKSSFQLKTLVTDSVKNPSGGYTYSVHRYSRPDSLSAWTDLDTWTAQRSNTQAIINQSNILYLKFVFPFSNKGVWNSNLYNAMNADYDTLRNVYQPYVLPAGKKFLTTVTTETDNGDFFVYHDRRVEVYAPSIGLIYKETIQLNYFTDPTCYGLQEVKSGVAYYQSLLSYGHQ